MSHTPNPLNLSCPTPVSDYAAIRLGHGSGGRMSANLLESIFLPQLNNPFLAELGDSAQLELGRERLAFTTDSYVVKPIFFPGGDIGSLSVHGTINDLSVSGAKPLYLSASFILEEGLLIEDLAKIVNSMAEACNSAGIPLVTGDTKVVDRGSGDKIFITTSGIGVIYVPTPPKANAARPGDLIIVSGDLGLHGMAIMAAREGLELETTIESDSAPLYGLVKNMFDHCSQIHCLRDITRGGLATVLNELAQSSMVGMQIDSTKIPVHPQVQAACEILGLDPLYVACEGRLVSVVVAESAQKLLSVMQKHPEAIEAAIIGTVVAEHPGRVVMSSQIGGKRILDKLSGEQLPRIC